LLLTSEKLRIENEDEVDLRLDVHYNPEVCSLALNASIAGLGPICRLELNCSPHRPQGRYHKHSLHTPRCPDQNLPLNVEDMSALKGLSIERAIGAFFEMARIKHEGKIEVPEAVSL
jgi:hypothetical protein